MRKHTLLILTLASQLLFTSCDLFMSKIVEPESFNATATCELDTDALAKYFTVEITPELNCLGSYLNDFIEVVRTDRPGYLSLDELVIFIQTNMKDFDQDLIEPIAGIFQMNSLLYGDHPRYISRNHVNKLVNVFIQVNKIVVRKEVYKSFVDTTPKDYALHNEKKAKIFEAFNAISNLLRDEYKGNTNSLSLTNFLDKFRSLLEDEEPNSGDLVSIKKVNFKSELDKCLEALSGGKRPVDTNAGANVIDNSEKLVFVKKILLGGEKNILTASELNRLLNLMPSLVNFIFDVSQFEYISKDESEEEGLIQTLNSGSKTVKDALYYDERSDEPLFTIDELFNAINVFYPEIAKYKKYNKEIKIAKNIFLGSNSESFSGREIYRLIDGIVHENLNRGEFFYRAYMLNKNELDDNKVINFDFDNIFSIDEREEEYIKSFNRIVRNYSYFKGSDSVVTLSQEIKRSPYAIFEISVIEDLLMRVIQSYGSHEDNNIVGKKAVTQEDLNALFEDFKDVLIGEGIVFIDPATNKDRLKNTVETFTLMTTLFQHQSSGDGAMEVNELTEFAIGLFSSMALADTVHREFQEIFFAENGCTFDTKGRYPPSFYRANLETVLEKNYNGKKIRDYIPGVADYVAAQTNDDFLKVTENFSRSCTNFSNGDDIPMEESDYFSMFVGISAIDQTINRFDKDGVNVGDGPDGVLQPNEVMNAFPIYKTAVENIIPIGFLKRYSKGFFQYLIKYEKVPDVQGIKSLGDFWKAVKDGVHFVKFLLTPERKRLASADRYTFAKILEVLADFSPEAKENPFPCDALK